MSTFFSELEILVFSKIVMGMISDVYSTLGRSRTPPGTGLRPHPRRLTVHGVSAGGESGCFLAGRVGSGGASRKSNANFSELEFFVFSKFVGE